MKTPILIPIVGIGALLSSASAQTILESDFTNNSFGDNTVWLQPTAINFDTWYAGHANATAVVSGELSRDASVRNGGTGFGGIFAFNSVSGGNFTFSFDYTALDEDVADTLSVIFDVHAYDGSGAMDTDERMGIRSQSGNTTFNSNADTGIAPVSGANYTVTNLVSLTSLGDPGFALGTSQSFSTTIAVPAGTDYLGLRWAAQMENPAGGGDTFTVDNVSVVAIPEPSSMAVLAGIFCLSLARIRRRR